MECGLVKILVVVANSYVRIITAYVDKASERSVFGFGLVGSKNNLYCLFEREGSYNSFTC
jgi:hypothetical protein